MKTAEYLDMNVALNLSKILVHKDVSKHVIDIVSRYATTAELDYPLKSGDQRWLLTWPGETCKAQKVALQEAAAALINHGYSVSLRP